MNWDGTVAGVKDGEKRRFDNLDRQVSGLTADDDDLSGGSSSQNNNNSSTTRSEGARRNIAAATNNENGGGVPFARIDAVAADSPAEVAGLKEEDLIVTFGDLHAENHAQLKAIAELVPMLAAEQKGITVRVQRHYTDETVVVTLVPKPWSGRGLLGCHIVPYTPP
jgi:C-terminal processing protease CtpA/Prc